MILQRVEDLHLPYLQTVENLTQYAVNIYTVAFSSFVISPWICNTFVGIFDSFVTNEWKNTQLRKYFTFYELSFRFTTVPYNASF